MKLNGFCGNRNITGELILKYREEKGISRDKLALQLSLIGITLYETDIFRIENNQRSIRDFELLGICRILGIPSKEAFECLKN